MSTEGEATVVARWLPYRASDETQAIVDACMNKLYKVRAATLRQLGVMTGIPQWKLDWVLRKHSPFQVISKPMEFYADGKWKKSNKTYLYTLGRKMVRYYETTEQIEDGFLAKSNAWTFAPRDAERAAQTTEIYSALCDAGYKDDVGWLNSVQIGSYVCSRLGIIEPPKINIMGGAVADIGKEYPLVWGIALTNRSTNGLEMILQFSFPDSLKGIIQPLWMVRDELIKDSIHKLKNKMNHPYGHVYFLPYEWSLEHPDMLAKIMLRKPTEIMEKWANGYRYMGWQIKKLYEDREISANEPYQWEATAPDGTVELCDTTFGKSLSQAYELAMKRRRSDDNRKYKRVLYVTTESEKAAWESLPKPNDNVYIEYRLINWPI